jgi:predicted nuclease of restriction endonuclease-like (RecB) superfamily
LVAFAPDHAARHRERTDVFVEQAKMGGWSVRELERNIRTDMFHRVVQNQLPEDSTALDTKKTNATQSKTIASQIKDPYILEFLGIKPEIHNTEKDLESAILSHIEKFLLELGKGFSFVERQMHIKTETQDFYIDLVFYNYILKCFILIDLKTGALKHQDIGQMDMYVRMFNDIRKADDDNPTVGIIFCSSKDDSIVKYSVLNDSEHLFANKYKLVLPAEDELAEELTRNRHRLEEFYKKGNDK